MKYQILSFCLAFLLSWGLMKLLLPMLTRLKVGQSILQYVTEHNSKQGTPTMGGITFIVSFAVLSLVMCGTQDTTVNVTVAVTVAYGMVGFLDDFIKVHYKHNLGLRPYQKVIVQLAISVAVAMYVWQSPYVGSKLNVPFVNTTVDFGWAIIPFIIFIYLAMTNGVNLTDGLDGLATTTTLCYLVGVFLVVYSDMQDSLSLGMAGIAERQSHVLVCIAVMGGSLLAFLLFNCFPAKVFMGDVGSLALGAFAACIAIFTNNSLLIPILGVMYVVSCLSVIVQVGYFKLTKGKRVFLMAPYHHHLQHKSLSETRIVTIYAVITLLATLVLLYFGG